MTEACLRLVLEAGVPQAGKAGAPGVGEHGEFRTFQEDSLPPYLEDSVPFFNYTKFPHFILSHQRCRVPALSPGREPAWKVPVAGAGAELLRVRPLPVCPFVRWPCSQPGAGLAWWVLSGPMTRAGPSRGSGQPR